ncbi:hypothetical protein QFC24_004586 [Naganishia onofrii]|uniref:Uncharacterized protein n=1 Tax=Naganishia onofrii TaxID=1851511 RepID=A0ACC2XD76_9TREE|nr:hypothetical protein QFC24_004586 [Naganishia onofrii]
MASPNRTSGTGSNKADTQSHYQHPEQATSFDKTKTSNASNLSTAGTVGRMSEEELDRFYQSILAAYPNGDLDNASVLPPLSQEQQGDKASKEEPKTAEDVWKGVLPAGLQEQAKQEAAEEMARMQLPAGLLHSSG